MIWMVCHRWPAGAGFLFNWYRHWAQLLLHQSDNAPVILLIQEGIAQGYPLLMVLYDITPVPLVEELRYLDPNFPSPFYANDATFNRSERWSAVQLRMLIDQGADRDYFLDPEKSLFIEYNPEKKEAERPNFEQAGIYLNYENGSQYLGALLGTREELEA